MKVISLFLLSFALFFSCNVNNEKNEDKDIENSQDDLAGTDDIDEEPDLIESTDEGSEPDDESQDADLPEQSQYILENGFEPASVGNMDDFSDLQPLKEILKDKRIIMIGDNNHGAAETKKYMTRMIAFIYKEFGTASVLWEKCASGGKLVDSYIQTGDTSYIANLDDLDFRQLASAKEEVDVYKDLFKINSERAEGAEPLNFYGIDILSNNRNDREFLRKYLESCEKKEIIDTFDNDYDALKNSGEGYYDICDDLIVVIETLITEMNNSKDELISKSSEEEFNENLDTAYAILNSRKTSCLYNEQLRDDSIFKNFEKVLARETGKLIIAYGQGHVQNEQYLNGGIKIKTLAQQLKEKYDSLGIYLMASEFSHGTVSYNSVDGEGNVDLAETDLSEMGENYLPYYFSLLGKDLFYLDWHDVDRDDLSLWLNETYFLSTGTKVKPSRAYDGLFYIDTVTPLTCCVTREDLEN